MKNILFVVLFTIITLPTIVKAAPSMNDDIIREKRIMIAEDEEDIVGTKGKPIDLIEEDMEIMELPSVVELIKEEKPESIEELAPEPIEAEKIEPIKEINKTNDECIDKELCIDSVSKFTPTVFLSILGGGIALIALLIIFFKNKK